MHHRQNLRNVLGNVAGSLTGLVLSYLSRCLNYTLRELITFFKMKW
jgi:hypothetical protein